MKPETATLAGGCFWCTEAIFKRLKGIVSVESGYAGGKGDNPNYEEVSSGKTGFAEAVQVEFDPKVLPYQHLLDIFWVIHDPTTLNRQGPDTGTQYRSVIFYHDEEQRKAAEKSKPKDAVTEIVPFDKFFTAEQYHQNYYEKNRFSNPYCTLIIDPKIEKLLEKFNKDIKKEYLMNPTSEVDIR
ncbi:peptide-methionine (S)-S-oxide reductase MsrA [Candidatus Daviesbacteria bacterium]|nr:peptide-methionine (S)-S-oxide reductase MsrA [Candidatus Daviesbacteria bacterium]